MFVHKNNDNVLVALISDKTVYVHCIDSIVSFAVYENNGQGILLCLSDEGDLFRVIESHMLRRASEQPSGGMEATVEIFEDLLRSEEEDDDMELQLSDKLIIILEENDIFKKSDQNSKIVGMCIGDGCLVLHKSDNVFEVYKHCADTDLVDDKLVVRLPRDVDKNGGNHEKLEKKTLFKIVTCDKDCENTNSSDVIGIGANLFMALFGEELTLLSSSVILLCLNNVSSTSVLFTKLPKANIKCDLDILNTLEDDHDFQWTTLCQMSSRIVDVTAISLAANTESSANQNSALCIITHHGHVTIFHRGISNSQCLVSEIYLCSPVLTVCVYNNRLYHSTGKQLFESTCVLDKNDTDTLSGGKLTLKSKALNESNIVQLYASPIEGYTDALDSPCKLMCVLRNKDWKEITVPLDDSRDASDAVSRQENIKDILKSMADISQKKEELRKLSDIQLNSINQLNIASYLLNCYLKSTNSADPDLKFADSNQESRKKPFELKFSVSHAKCLPENDLNIECEITNQMPVSLSHDWLICINLHAGGENIDCYTVSRRLKSDWRTGKQLNISVPVTFRQCLVGCRLIVKAVLLLQGVAKQSSSHLDLFQTKPCFHGNRMVSENREPFCLSISVLEEDLDIIHCLVRDNTFSNACETGITRLRDALIELAEKRSSILGKQNPTKDKLATTVCTKNNVKLPVTGNVSMKDVSLAFNSLLGNDLVKETDIVNGGCSLRTLAGHSIHMTLTQKKNLGTSHFRDGNVMKGQSGCYGDLEVTVRSTLEIAAAVHKALNKRVCKLPGKEYLSAKDLCVSDTIKLLTNVKEVQRQLEGYVSRSQSEGHQNICSVYEKLRNICL